MGCGMSQPPKPHRSRRSEHGSEHHSGHHHHHGQRRHGRRNHGQSHEQDHEYNHEYELQTIGPSSHGQIYGQGYAGNQGLQVQTAGLPTVGDLGYEVREQRSERDSDRPQRILRKFVITQPGNGRHIAMLNFLVNSQNVAIHPESEWDEFTLDVEWIAMDNDLRSAKDRPRARDVLVAFWVHTARRHLVQLRRIRFQNVTEATTRAVVKRNVCRGMGIRWDEATKSPDREFLYVWGPGQHDEVHGNQAAFAALCQSSILLRVVAGMVAKYPDMMQPGAPLAIVWIRIDEARDGRGRREAFHMEVALEDVDVTESSSSS